MMMKIIIIIIIINNNNDNFFKTSYLTYETTYNNTPLKNMAVYNWLACKEYKMK